MFSPKKTMNGTHISYPADHNKTTGLRETSELFASVPWQKRRRCDCEKPPVSVVTTAGIVRLYCKNSIRNELIVCVRHACPEAKTMARQGDGVDFDSNAGVKRSFGGAPPAELRPCDILIFQ